jgi:hypothetical protein
VIVGVAWVVRTVWEDRRVAGVGQAIWQMIWQWIGGLWSWWQGVRARIERVLPGSHETATAGLPATSMRLRWWQARSTRERVRRLYLTLLERSARTGYPRLPAQTPNEYGVELESHVPGHEAEIRALTEAFVEARYGRREFEPGRLYALHELWQRLLKALRRPPSE